MIFLIFTLRWFRRPVGGITPYLWTDSHLRNTFLNLRASTTKEFKLPCVSVTPYLQSSTFPMVWVKHGQGSSKNDAARGPRFLVRVGRVLEV